MEIPHTAERDANDDICNIYWWQVKESCWMKIKNAIYVKIALDKIDIRI